MPRIGRSFPPQWNTPNPSGRDRALGPHPPQPPQPPPPIQVNLASDLLRRRTMTRRFPLPGYDEQQANFSVFSSPILDHFDRANENPLSGGGNWAEIFTFGELQLVNGSVTTPPIPSGLNQGNAYWTPQLYADCEAYFTLGAPLATDSTGHVDIYLRWDPATNSGYRVSWVPSDHIARINRVDNGSFVGIGGDVAATVAVGDKLGARVIGSSIEIWVYQGGSWTLLETQDDPTYLTGRIGLGMRNDGSTQPSADDFGGGPLAPLIFQRRRLGPQPPLVIGPVPPPPPVVTTLSVNLASGLLTNQRRAQQRFPRQWYEGSETDVGSPRPAASSIIVYPERALGPDPPTVIDPAPPVAPFQVNLATGVLTNQRRAQQRRTQIVRTPLPPPLPPPPPGQYALAITLAARSRRNTEQRRFPLQGWDGDGHLSTAASIGPLATGAAGRSTGGNSVNPRVAFGTVLQDPSTAAEKKAVRLLVPWATSSFVLAVALCAKNASSDNAVVSIQGDSNGAPNGVIVGSISIPAASIPQTANAGGPTPKEFTGVINAALVPEQEYWLVFDRDGGLGISAYYYTGFLPTTASLSTSAPNPFYPTLTFDGSRWRAMDSGNGLATAYWKITPLDNPQTSTPIIRRNLGPRPPEYTIPVLPVPVAPLQVNLATGVLTNQRRNTQRRTMYDLFGFIPQVSAQPPPPIQVTGLYTNQRRVQQRRPDSFYTESPYLSPLAVVTTPGQLAVAAHATRTRPRPARSSLPLTLAAASTFATPPIRVTLVRGRPRPTEGAVAPPLIINPLPSQTQETAKTWVVVARPRPVRSHLPVVIGTTAATFAGPEVTLQAVQTRAQRQRRRLPDSFLSPPATLEPETVALAERQIRVTLARTRLRHTLGTKLGYTVYPAASDITVALVRTRPRPTRHALTATTYPQTGAGFTHLVRARPRPTRKFVAPPATLQPYAVTVAEDTVRVTAVRTRPRPTTRRVNPPTVLQVFTGPAAPLVRTRPRPTQRRLTAISYPATSAIRVVLTRTRPRPTSRTLGPLIFYAQTSEIAATLARIRPRRTLATVRPPAVTTVAQAFYGPTVLLARTRPRHVTPKLAAPVFYAATSEITVTAVRTRPRPTRHLLTSITYQQTGVGFKHLVRTRPRPTTRFLLPPATLQPYAVTLAEDTIRVAVARTRPRPTTRRLAPPTVLQTFAAPRAPSVRIRPRHTVAFVAPPATLEPEAVSLAEREIRVVLTRTRPRHTLGTRLSYVVYPQTSKIAVALTRTRPRPTVHRLTAVSYPAASEITVTLVRGRSRPLTRFVAPPATLQPYAVTLAEDTVRVTAVRTRPRHTLGTRLIPPTVLRTFAGPAVTLTHTRPRPTLRRLGPATVVRVPSVEQREDTITVALVHTRPRPTEKFIVPPLVKTFPPVVTTLLPAHVIKTRPRPTHSILRPPTVVIPLPTLRMQTITVALVHTRPRPTRHSLTPLAFYRQTSKIQVVLARTRPRPTAKRLQPPIFYKQTSEIQVVLTRTRPRPTTRILTAVRYEQATEIAVALTRTRPRPTRHFLAPPTVLQTFGPPVEVEIAVRTPLEDRARHKPRSFEIQPVTYAAQSELAVKLTRTRPRPTRSILRPPTAVRAFVAAPVTVVTVRSRPRRTHSFLIPPTAVRTFTAQPIQVATVTARPRPTTARIEPPTRLRPIETTLHVALARTRPRRVHSVIPAVLVEAEPPVVTTITVTLAHTRPRPTRSILRPPATLRRVVVAFIAPPITVVTVTTRPPQTHVFRVTPFPFFRGRDGFTTSTLIPSAMGTDSSIVATGGAVSAVVGDSADSTVIATASGDIEDTLADGGEILDRPGGLT